MSYFEDGDCPAQDQDWKLTKRLFWIAFGLIGVIVVLALFLFRVSADVVGDLATISDGFDIPKGNVNFYVPYKLEQAEVDPNYPCHIENNEEIVCPAISSEKIVEWQSDIVQDIVDASNQAVLEGEAVQEVVDPAQSSDVLMLANGKTKFNVNGLESEIDVTQEFRRKVDLNNEHFLKIGFHTNTFFVSGQPLENFDVNITAGTINYRPLNSTYLVLDGINDYTSVTIPVYTSERAFSAWLYIKSSSSPIRTRPFDFGVYTNATMYNNGYINREANTSTWSVGSTSFNSTGTVCQVVSLPFPLNTWFHVVWSRNSTTGLFYYNGVLNSTDTSCGFENYSSNSAVIRAGAADYFNGSIDDLTIWNRSLTASEVSSLYNLQRRRNITLAVDGLIAKYTFNEMNASSVYDFSPNSYNLTVFNGATYANDGINVTTLGYNVNITINNFTNAYIRWDNMTVIQYNYTGNLTFTFLNNQTINTWTYYQCVPNQNSTLGGCFCPPDHTADSGGICVSPQTGAGAGAGAGTGSLSPTANELTPLNEIMNVIKKYFQTYPFFMVVVAFLVLVYILSKGSSKR